MPFGIVSGVGRGMGVLDGGGDRRKKRDSFGAESGRPVVTYGDFVARLCESDALFPNYFGKGGLVQRCPSVSCPVVSVNAFVLIGRRWLASTDASDRTLVRTSMSIYALPQCHCRAGSNERTVGVT